MPASKGTSEFISYDSPRLHQDKKCQYCSKEFNTGSDWWKKFCSRQCRQNQYVFNKTGRKPMSHAQVDLLVPCFFGENDSHKIHCNSFIFNDLQQKKVNKTELYFVSLIFTIGDFAFSVSQLFLPATHFVVRSLLRIISPVSNSLLRANRFFVEMEAI